MAERVKYLGVTMEAATAEVLARLDAEQWVPTSGLWLYAVVKTLGSLPATTADTDDLYVLIWLALATQKVGGEFGARVSEENLLRIQTLLQEAGIVSPVLATNYLPTLLVDKKSYDHKESVSFFENIQSFRGSPYGSSHLLITPVIDKTETPYTLRRESVVVGGAWRLYGGQKIPYAVSDREKLVAILLAAIQPTTLALGMNVVFDGKIKPARSKISFSGSGGQIGEGDVLICHPNDLNRYTPLPGAVALVLGEITEPVNAFTCALPVGDEVLTIVIK